MRIWIAGMAILFITACSSNYYAPVDNANSIWQKGFQKPHQYKVQQGDTIDSVAFRYNMEARTLATVNHLVFPYTLHSGQVLSLDAPPPVLPKESKYQREESGWHVVSVPVKVSPVTSTPKSVYPKAQTMVVSNKTAQPMANTSGVSWQWPASGKIILTFSQSQTQRGVDIAGQLGEPIYAAASGKVAYAGNALKGYGNLVIIKHNDNFLSAYAHNQKLLVHEGDTVHKGQKIATMGSTEADRVMLHFEIREAGQSVDPLKYVQP